MDDTPDFEALAHLWLSRDPRAAELDEDAQAKIVARLAKALKARRDQTDHSAQDVGLIVNVDRDNIIPGKGLADSALDQLTNILKERIEEENRDKT